MWTFDQENVLLYFQDVKVVASKSFLDINCKFLEKRSVFRVLLYYLMGGYQIY